MHEKLFHPQAMLQQLKENLNKKRNKVFTVADWDSWVSAASFVIDSLDKVANELEQEITGHGQNEPTVDYHGGPQLVNFTPDPGAQGQGTPRDRGGSTGGSGPRHESKVLENVTRNAQRENAGDDPKGGQGKQEQGQTKKEGK